MDGGTAEKEIHNEIRKMLDTAENYLWRAKLKKEKHVENFEFILAIEYATKAKDKCGRLVHMKEFYEDSSRRADAILEELASLGIKVTRRKSREEIKYEEEGDAAGG